MEWYICMAFCQRHPKKARCIRLVLTSGDFGLAYLTERWAARFVSELFRNFVVCFVGYSINDPVLRYMMDALAADRMLGEISPQAYALGDFAAGQEPQKRIEWEAKNVNPILYEVPTGTNDHSALHGTLKMWAETYRDGVYGSERIYWIMRLRSPWVLPIKTAMSGGCCGLCHIVRAYQPDNLLILIRHPRSIG